MSMLELLDRRNSFSSISSPIKVTNSIAKQDILDLVDGKYACLRIPNYYPDWLCSQLCQNLLKLPEFSRYLRAKDVGVQRTGLTFFETKGDANLLNQYYSEASKMCAAIRNSCFPYLAPIDKLRLELEERWPMGARLENIHGKTMMVGIVRMFEEHFELPPHQDVLARDMNEDLDRVLLQTQLSANIYLQGARYGGELEVWKENPCQKEFLKLSKDGLHLDPDKLSNPEVSIKPMTGDLILFDSGRVHAVRPSVDGTRVSMSCFVGYRGQKMPLTYWS
ncbi:2OG-Fe(II) oxygenase [Altericista sp. CCNU0014]|uniref:2OG-Fe(II) oxygenase family protein n=1 Tax=Altericista sp. CCNU0014 TaxID=3082949 RepID=UPI0038515321